MFLSMKKMMKVRRAKAVAVAAEKAI